MGRELPALTSALAGGVWAMIPLTAISRSIFLLLALCLATIRNAQDLAPQAYIITQVCWNAVTLTYSFSDGGLLFNNVLPITNATATLNVPSP